MTAVLLLADGALTLGAGAAFAGLVRVPLRLIERVLIAVVAGVILGSAATFLLALPAGLSVATVLLGPALVIAGCVAAASLWTDGLASWRESLDEARQRWSAKPPTAMLVVTLVATAFFGAIFAHTVFTSGGDLDAGYQTVWADWSQHLTTSASFAVSSNLPPQNPLFSGTALLYPFLPDLHSATLVVLGLSPQAALAVPGGVLAVVITLLVICLARRLGIGFGAGVVAAAVVFVGGGLGFIGTLGDACGAAGYSAAQCNAGHVIADPVQGVHVIAGTLQHIPGIISAQPRAYDALLTPESLKPFPNMQWYTPLFAWWLPQRTMLYGFALALCVFVLIAVAVRKQGAGWTPFVVSGILLGLLPLVHLQTLLAVSVVLLVLALRHRRVEWLGVLAGVAVLGLPRLVQITFAPHGSVAFDNAYPWLEPGWLSNAFPATATSLAVHGAGDVVADVGRTISLAGNATWWGFWFINLGVVVPLSALAVIGAAFARGPARIGVLGRRLTAAFPAPLLEFALASTVVFALCNIIVFQSWDWDNTKLLVYWYLAGALLVGALAGRWWGRGLRTIGSVVLVSMTVLTGVVVLLRLLPWTPATDSVTGPYTIASADERALAAVVEARTAPNAVFLTYGRPNDPILAVAGRPGLMGYYGWLWSYGTDFGSRYGDVKAMYRGCAIDDSACPVPFLLQKYRVSYVEVDDRVDSAGAIEPNENLRWWAAQGYPVVARTPDIVVYDVRR